MGSLGDEFRLNFPPKRGKKGASGLVSDTPGALKEGIWRFSRGQEE
jgi:hypothetical protein